MKSISHTHTFETAASIDELFPLFSPEGEKHRVPGWGYENVMGTTELREDYVFKTTSHDHGAAGAIWVVKRHEPGDGLVEFIKVEPEQKVGIVKVNCTALAAQRAQVEVTYTYTALSPAGEQFVAGFDRAAYTVFIEEWETLLSNYFERRRQ